MRILLINQYAGSPSLGMEHRPYDLAVKWQMSGHQVTIATAAWSHLRRRNVKVKGDYREKRVDGVRYLFFRSAPYRGAGIDRALSVAFFVAGLMKHAKFLALALRPDLVIASSTHPFDIWPAAHIAKLTQARLIYEIHDLWPLSLQELHGYHEDHPLVRLVNAAQSYAVRRADGVVSILPYADRYLEELGLAPSKYCPIPNGISANRWVCSPLREDDTGVEVLRQRKSRGDFIILYAGGFAAANAMDYFVEAARRAPEGMLFVAVGSGVQKKALCEKAENLKLRNLLVLRAAPRSGVPELLALADCLYIGARKSRLYAYGIGMNKLWEYMYAGRPILFAVDCADNPVAEAGCGVTVSPEDPDAIVRGAKILREMSAVQRSALGAHGKSYVLEGHNCLKLANHYIQFVEECGQ